MESILCADWTAVAAASTPYWLAANITSPPLPLSRRWENQLPRRRVFHLSPLLIADIATKNWCRLTIGLGRSGQLWQVWQQPPGDPTALSIIHCENPISLITISIAPEHFVEAAIAPWESRFLCSPAFDLVKDSGLGKRSVREETGRTSESARSRYNPSPPPDLIIRSIPPLKICRVSHFKFIHK